MRRLLAAAMTLGWTLTVGATGAQAPGAAAPVPEPTLPVGPPTSTQPPLPIPAGTQPASDLLLPALEPTVPGAPAVVTAVEGINFDEDASNTGFFHIPPDPIGAAGPGHLVSVVNTSIEWHTKDGTQQNSQCLALDGSSSTGCFFASLTPLANVFDPKVIYDQYAGRFVVVALERVDNGAGSPTNSSRILVAVSDDGDPNGTWFFTAIDSKINIGGTDHWADYPGFAVDEEAVYITNNMFTFGSGIFGGSRLWIIDKGLSGGFYTGAAASVNVYDAPTAAGTSATTMQPAHVFGPGGIPGAGNPGTFLVRYSGFTNGVTESLSIIRVDDPLGAAGGPSFSHQFLNVGDIDNTSIGVPDAPQSGTSTLVDTGDRRALHAVWRNNSLWLTALVVPGSGPDAGQATAHWWEVDTSNLGALSLLQQSDLGGEDIATGAYTFFPSIAVDGSGNMAVGFAASASTIFPGAYYTGRRASDASDTVDPTGALAEGLDFYVRTFGGTRNRWGDYSGISVDPADDAGFWAFNEYALTRGTVLLSEDGRWGTRWGGFSMRAPALAVVGVHADGRVRAEIRDAISGDLRNTVFFNENFAPQALASVPDMSGNAEPELAVLGVRASDGRVRVEVKDSVTDEAVSSIVFPTLDPTGIGTALAVLPPIDGNGVPELAVLGHVDAAVTVQVRDAATGTLLNIVPFSPDFTPVAVAVVPNLSSGGFPAVAVLGKHADGRVRVEMRDALADTQINRVLFNPALNPIALAVLPDQNGNGVAELAVLGTLDGPVRAQVRDGATGEVINNMPFQAAYGPLALAPLSDVSGNHRPELTMLGLHADGRVRTQTDDALTDTALSFIRFSSLFSPKGLAAVE